MKSDRAREYQVKEFMGRKIRTVGSGSSVQKAVEIMVENGIGSVAGHLHGEGPPQQGPLS